MVLLSQRESFVTVKIFESQILMNFDVFENPESGIGFRKMYVYMYVCMYVCMYVYMYVCMYVWMYEDKFYPRHNS